MTTSGDWRNRTALLCISFFIELPFDAGLDAPQRTRTIHFHEGELDDWPDLDLDALLGMPPHEEPGNFPSTTFYFRRAVVDAEEPLAATRAAFPSAFPDNDRAPVSRMRRWAGVLVDVSFLAWFRIREELGRAAPEAHYERRQSRTVIHAIRVIRHPTGIFSSKWLDDCFDNVLEILNDLLVALAAASNEPRIGPVTRNQLPAVILGYQADLRDGLPIQPKELMFLSHSEAPHVGRDLSEPTVARAMEIVGNRDGPRPFFMTLEFTLEAQRSLLSGRLRQAVLESGTSIELLIHTAVREVARGEGWANSKFENVAKVFRNLVCNHFAPIFGFDPDLDTSGDMLGNWWRAGYKLRNRVAHEGYSPTRAEVIDALKAASELHDAVGICLSRHPATTASFPHQSLQQAPSIAELLEQADPEQAEAILHADETLDPSVKAFNLGVVLLRRGREQESEEQLRFAVDEGGHAGAALTLGGLCSARGQAEEARSFYKLAADSMHPRYSPAACLALGQLLGDGDPDEAEFYYRRAIASDRAEVVPQACFELGGLLAEHDRSIEAERLWEQAAEMDEGRSLVNLGSRCQARGDYVGAEARFRRALETDFRPVALVNLGLLLCALERPEEAIQLLREASDLGNGRAALALAAIELRNGDTESARPLIELATRSPEEDVAEQARALASELPPAD